MTLKSILSTSNISFSATQTLASALQTMEEKKISSVVVVDENQQPVGIFTEHDSLHVVAKSINVNEVLQNVMTPHPVCVDQSLYLHDAYLIMEEKGYRHLVVVDATRRFVGIVSEGDFLRHMGFEELNRFKSVADIMSTMPLILSPSTTVIETASLMEAQKADYVVLMDEQEVVGIVTERDIAHCCVHHTKEVGQKSIGSLAHKNFEIVKKDFLLNDATVLMNKSNIHQLIIVDDKEKLLGSLTRHDVLHAVHGGYFDFLIGLVENKNSAITQLEQNKDALKREKESIEANRVKHQKLFESIPDGVVLVDTQTFKAVDFNAAVHTTLGYTAEEFSNLTLMDYEVIESAQEIQRRAETIHKNGADNFVTIHKAKDGTLIDTFVSVRSLELAGSFYLMAIYRDISQQKKGELLLLAQKRELEQQKSLLSTLINTTPDLVWLKDLNGVYLACNAMFGRLYNATESQIVGKDDFDFVAPDLARFFQENDKAAIQSGTSRMNEEHLVFADGSYDGDFETIKTPTKDANGTIIGVLGVARDISERKVKIKEIDQIQSLAHIGTWQWELHDNSFSGSPEAYRIFGLPYGEKVTLSDLLQKFSPQEGEKMQYNLLEASKEKKQLSTIYKIYAADGSERWIKTHTEFQYDKEHNPIRAIGLFQDLTEQIGYEKELQQKDEDLNKAQALARVGSWKYNIVEDVLEWSDETYRIFGVDKEQKVSYALLLEHVHPQDVEKLNFAWNEALKTKKYDIEHRIITYGEIRWVHESAEFELDALGNALYGLGTVQDITQRKLYEHRLETLANYDPLTGLANRSLLISHLKKSLSNAKRSKKQVALLMFDLDRFKDVNDSYGHNAGDELLQQVAQRFLDRLREGDLVSRLGGDEFAVVLQNIVYPQDAGHLAQEMIENLSQDYKLSGGISVHVSASAGIVVYPDNAEDAATLLQYGDAALYKSKAEGRGTFRYYSDELTQLARKRVECEVQLRRAIMNHEFEVYYQPQVHIASGRIVGAEALVRWNHPERGVVGPVEFIPIAEDLGLISEIDEWVLNDTCRQGKIWQDLGYRLTLAVNLAPYQVRHTNVVAVVEAALKKSGYDPKRLELELTESAFIDREEEVIEMLHTLRAKGIRLAIDDFGTGYSSLNYLKRFPLDVLKIDKSFVDDVPYENDDMAIVIAIIAMGKALNFQILAEGVEHLEQLEFLKEKGCTMYQGYFKSKPIPAKAFELLLEDEK